MTCGCGCGHASSPKRAQVTEAGQELLCLPESFRTSAGCRRVKRAGGGDVRLVIAAQRLDLSVVRVGDSICVQGCCLTATAVQARTFAADVSRETLALTTLGELQPDAAGESRARAQGRGCARRTPGVGTRRRCCAGSRGERRRAFPCASASGYRRRSRVTLAPKGSVAVDGVSLTIKRGAGGELRRQQHSFPTRARAPPLGAVRVGARVNLEVDQVARYLARLLALPAT